MATNLREVIRSGLAAWSRGDLEGVLDTLDPDCEFTPSGAFPGLERSYRGHDGYRRFWRDFRGAWEDISIEIERIIEAESSVFVVVARFRARGRDGLTVERPTNLVFTGGEVAIKRIAVFGSWEAAFEAAGLPPAAGA